MHQLRGQGWRDGIFTPLFSSEDSHVLRKWLLGNLQAARCCPSSWKRQIWGSVLSVRWWGNLIYLRKAYLGQCIIFSVYCIISGTMENNLEVCSIVKSSHFTMASQLLEVRVIHCHASVCPLVRVSGQRSIELQQNLLLMWDFWANLHTLSSFDIWFPHNDYKQGMTAKAQVMSDKL